MKKLALTITPVFLLVGFIFAVTTGSYKGMWAYEPVVWFFLGMTSIGTAHIANLQMAPQPIKLVCSRRK